MKEKALKIKKHWKLEILNENETGLGGYKEF